jgi:acyl-CoA thioester hydrolase
MPLTTTRTFRVRSYECDAYGHLNNSQYLRYMQEAAFDATAAAGFDKARYARMGRAWYIHSSEIEYLRPVQYNDTVEVTTWVSDFRRVSSRREYDLRLAGTGEPVARAHSDWVYVDTATNKPVSIPNDMAQAFFPDGMPESFPRREPFPSAPLPPPGVFRIRRPVEWGELDAARHVNNAVYSQYVMECGMQVLRAYRWPWERMEAAGFAILLRRSWLQYVESAVDGDELEISTWASEMRRSTAVRYYTIQRVQDGALLARIHTLGVWVDLRTGRPIRIPAEFVRDFAANIA